MQGESTRNKLTTVSTASIWGITVASAILFPHQAAFAQPSIVFNSPFNVYANGNLAGQFTWRQFGAPSSLPIQIVNGQAVIAGGQTSDNQDAFTNVYTSLLSLTGSQNHCYGLVFYVQSAPTLGGPIVEASPFAALLTGRNNTGSPIYQINAKNAGSGYVLGARISGDSLDPFTFGTSSIPYDGMHVLIMEAIANLNGGMVMRLFLDPTSQDVSQQIPYLTHTLGAGASTPTEFGSFLFEQFANASTGNVGVKFDQFVYATDFLNVYINIHPTAPEPSSIVLAAVGIPAAVFARRRRYAAGSSSMILR